MRGQWPATSRTSQTQTFPSWRRVLLGTDKRGKRELLWEGMREAAGRARSERAALGLRVESLLHTQGGHRWLLREDGIYAAALTKPCHPPGEDWSAVGPARGCALWREPRTVPLAQTSVAGREQGTDIRSEGCGLGASYGVRHVGFHSEMRSAWSKGAP